MSSKTSIVMKSQEQWDSKWLELFDHYQNDPRHAYYINAFVDPTATLIELAAGSFRDTAKLNEIGVNCKGTDFSAQAVKLAQERYPLLKKSCFQGDAFSLSMIDDAQFDISFHNGFWVLFEDDSDIHRLAEEQARISRTRMIATVHNAHNQQFVDYFARLSENDDLYKIRFFEQDEIESLMYSVCQDVRTVPVGKGKKFFEDLLINEGMSDRSIMRAYFDTAGLKQLENSERLLCIGTLNH